MDSIFKEIADNVGAKLEIIDDKYIYTDGSRSPHIVYSLSLNYKDRIIRITNSTGTTFVGNAVCIVSKPKESLEFEILTRSHFVNLFYRSKDRFKIETQNENIKSFLRQSDGFSKMKIISKDVMFDPTFIGKNTSEGFQLVTEYHLQFNNWWEVVEPLFLFYKEFIDRFD